jgi:hypothetical protein
MITNQSMPVRETVTIDGYLFAKAQFTHVRFDYRLTAEQLKKLLREPNATWPPKRYGKAVDISGVWRVLVQVSGSRGGHGGTYVMA